MQDITKVIVACGYCGIANLFTNGVCVKCGGTLKIELAVTDERLEEIAERSDALDERELNIVKRLTFVEQEKDRLQKKEIRLKLMETITDSFKTNRTKYILITFGCLILGIISFVISGYALSYVSSLPSLPYAPVTGIDSEVTDMMVLITPLMPVVIMLMLISLMGKMTKRGKRFLFHDLKQKNYIDVDMKRRFNAIISTP